VQTNSIKESYFLIAHKTSTEHLLFITLPISIVSFCHYPSLLCCPAVLHHY